MRERLWPGPGGGPDSRRVALVAAVLIAAVGLSVLAGWTLSLPLLASWLPGLVQTKVNAAVCFLLLGLALALSATNRTSRAVRAARVLAVAVVAIAGATFFEHVVGIDLGIDQALVLDRASASSPHPGRFAVETAVAFGSAAFGIIVLGRRFRGFYPSEILGLLCAAIGGISLVGYLYGATALLSLASATQVSLPAAFSLVLTGAALVAVDPRHGLVRQLADPGVGGQVLRRILPAAILVVPAGAWVRLMGERAGLYDETVGLSIVVVFEALVLLAVGAWTTARVERLEERRMQVEADLIRLGAAAATPLIETSAVGLAVLDRDLRLLYINPALAQIGGVSAISSLGRDIDRVVPAFGHATPALLRRVLAGGEAIRDLEVSGEARPGGRSATFLLSAEPLRDKGSEIVGLSISVVEITERKRREDALAEIAEMRQQHRAIDESIPFGIWIAGPNGAMRYLSESFLSMAGRTMEEARGFGWIGFLADESAAPARQDWADCVASGSPWNHELVVPGADGRRRTILSRGFPIRDDAGQITSWAGINLDISDRKDAEAFREAFTDILSHELGTPITSISAASTLLNRLGRTDARQAELLSDISHESERLRRLVEDLVVLAKSERGTIQVRMEPVLLEHLLPRVCEQAQLRWATRHFELTVVAPLPVARAEEGFVEQIVRNLLENAAKYGPVDGQIDLVADAPDGWPRVRVLDRGPGIDPDEADRLFEVFYRSRRTARVAGSGIGLFVAHRLVESIGGTIWARPRDDGPGSEFGFRLQPVPQDSA